MVNKAIKIDGKQCNVNDNDMNKTILEFLDIRKASYFSNPIVAAIVNGEVKPLDTKLMFCDEIETIHLFSPFGKRVYRKTLCFLLCYASASLFPERTLVIGHSLGDGFYFSYRGKEKPDIKALKSKMKEAIIDDIEISTVTLSAKEALKYARDHNLIETEKLLLSSNNSLYVFSSLNGVLELYYEPLLTSTGLLEVWDLMEYEDGMLLRYPQSRNPMSIMAPFTDNPLLFSIFKANKQIAKILDTESLGALNLKQTEGKIEEIIELSENVQRNRIAAIGSMIKSRGNVKAIFISGPSSSGKTTFSLKLCNELKINGYKPLKISLDDYYLPMDLVPVDENGEKDFEVLESLDVPLFQNQIEKLIEKEEVYLAAYDFKTRKHFFQEKPTKMDDNSIIVVEGIHGLNPNLIPSLDRNLTFKIYISALTQLNLDSRSRISTTDNRILRRMVRDNRTRGLDAVETLSRWASVERGEKNNIFPYQNNADVMINSALEYELGVLSPYAIPLLRSVKAEDGVSYAIARRLLSFLELVYPIPSDSVPSDSIIREFIGGSIFHAI